MKNVILSLLILAGSPVALLAHEGHGALPSSNALHYILEWVHGAPILLLSIVVIITAAFYVFKTSKSRNKS